jgi:peptide/nickel transport system permease protein
MGVFADFIASEKPVMVKMNNKIMMFPNYINYRELADIDNQNVLKYLTHKGDFVILPPVPYGPNQAKIANEINWLSPPDSKHILGTDASGRDVLSRIIHGCRSAVYVGIGSIIICTIFGVFWGAFAAYFGGFWDKISNLGIETLSAFPTLFLILGIQGLLGVSSLFQLVLVIGLTTWVDVARITRAEVLRTVNEEYIDAARALGLTNFRILFVHVLPAILAPVMVSSTFRIANAILLESTLSFLGYGAPPPVASWGQLIADAFTSQSSYWLVLFPGLMLFMTVLAINISGEGLGDSVDNN